MFETLSRLPTDVDESPARWFVTRNDELLLIDGAIPEGERPDVETTGERLLGVSDGVAVWGLDLADDARLPPGAELAHTFMIHGRVDDADWALAGRATQLARFARTHRFCSACGTPSEPHPVDRAQQCPACRHMVFPPVTPAIITIVERDGEILLAHGRQFPIPVFSALAGFVEPGESSEQAVVREVFEEVGVVVDNVAYRASQPWAFPHSLMLGFTARWVSGDIRIQESEIVEAGWFTIDEMPNMFPGTMSIANWLIHDWMRRQGAGPDEAPSVLPAN